MTQKSKSRNVLASPLGEEGHEVAKGVQANWIHRGAPRPANPVRRHPAKSVCTRVRMIMIFLFYVLSPFAQGAADWRSGPRWSILSVLCPVHPLPLRGVPLKGKREVWRGKTESHIFHVPFRGSPPLVVNAVSQSPECVSCHMTLKVNPVTLTLYSSPCGRYHNLRAKGPSNLRTLRPRAGQS